jgi:hypothetical protein
MISGRLGRLQMREQAKLSARGLFVVTGLAAVCAMLGRC